MDAQRISPDDIVKTAAHLMIALREKRPRIHCITNAAAQVFTANLLLAAGAIPSLTYAAEEVPDFVARAHALLINLGTLDAERRASIPLAIEAAQAKAIPWILDPVFVDASAPRLAWADQLLISAPTIMRCNRSEFAALSRQDFTIEHVTPFAARSHVTIAVTGAQDVVVSAHQRINIANGHPWMSQTTAMGCAGTALIAAFAAIGATPFIAASAGLLVLGIAGEKAANDAKGPGSFAAAFLDTLASLTPDDITRTARIFP